MHETYVSSAKLDLVMSLLLTTCEGPREAIAVLCGCCFELGKLADPIPTREELAKEIYDMIMTAEVLPCDQPQPTEQHDATKLN